MNLRAFIDLLDRHGSDLDRWPKAQADAARGLLTASDPARARWNEARRFEALFDQAIIPAAPSVAAIVEYATALPQIRRQNNARQPVAARGFGATWRYAMVFGSCLMVGVVAGAVSAPSAPLPYRVYDLIDGGLTGELHLAGEAHE